MPLWLPSHSAVAFGDAVVEAEGALRLWAQGPRTDRYRTFVRERFAPTLEPLVALAPERVLVTHGRPVLSGGAAALAAAEPWWLRG
jgi:glyoxylase-like metal-dependent hydrolase (beta-lactamase superfamily II)